MVCGVGGCVVWVDMWCYSQQLILAYLFLMTLQGRDDCTWAKLGDLIERICRADIELW